MSRPTADECEFASFWHGRLNPFAYACLASFPLAGSSLRVFSYNPRLDLPPGVRLEDATAVCPDESLTRRFVANGKPSIATFVHLWSEAIAWSGYDFWSCPPAGSYLYEAFRRLGALVRFRRVATEDEVLRQMAKPVGKSQLGPAASD